jgi:hypothetical protein
MHDLHNEEYQSNSETSASFVLGLASSNSGGASGSSGRLRVYSSASHSHSPFPRSRTTSATPESDISFMNDIFHYLGGDGEQSNHHHHQQHIPTTKPIARTMTRNHKSESFVVSPRSLLNVCTSMGTVSNSSDTAAKAVAIGDGPGSIIEEDSNQYGFFDIGLPLDDDINDDATTAFEVNCLFVSHSFSFLTLLCSFHSLHL